MSERDMYEMPPGIELAMTVYCIGVENGTRAVVKYSGLDAIRMPVQPAKLLQPVSKSLGFEVRLMTQDEVNAYCEENPE